MSSAKIKKGDLITVLSGTCKGKQGVVSAVLQTGRAIVKGLNIVRKNKKDGIIAEEAPIHLSNLQILDPVLKCATRVGFYFKNDSKVRYCKKSGRVL